MKKIFGFALTSIVIATSCKEKFEQPGAFSSFAVIQASPTATTPPSDTLNAFVEDAKYTSSGIVYLGTSFGPYLPVASGNHTINIRRGADAASSLYVSPFTQDFAPGSIYSFFIYDTTASATGQAKVLKLRDTLTLPATTPVAQSKFRFLHLAPNQAPVDVTFLRTSVTPNDSVTFSGRAYAGATPNETTLAAFTSVPKGAYTIKIKNAGTQTVVTSASITTTAAINGADITQGPIYTFFITGTAKGRALTLRSFKHY